MTGNTDLIIFLLFFPCKKNIFLVLSKMIQMKWTFRQVLSSGPQSFLLVMNGLY